ncbi:MAG: GAF domain-containing protein [Pseudomonadota bacterium]
MSLKVALADPDQPGATHRAVEALALKTVGAKLFTLMVLDHGRGVAWRCHTNWPDAYPASGEKPMLQNAWSKRVIERRETFVANTIDEIAAVFPDHELIQSLGCQSCLNLPVIVGGKVIGTVNFLHEAGFYTPERVAGADALSEPAALALILTLLLKDAP